MSASVDPRVERTRSVVVQATAELLEADGFERITIDAIAERSGVARSTIYRNWPDRPALLIEAFETMCDFGDPPDTGSLAGDLRTVARLLANGLANDAWGRSLPSLIGAAAHDEDMHAAQLAFNAGRRAAVTGVVMQAVERGEVSADVDIDLAIMRFAASFFFAHLFTDTSLDEAYVERVVHATVTELTA